MPSRPRAGAAASHWMRGCAQVQLQRRTIMPKAQSLERACLMRCACLTLSKFKKAAQTTNTFRGGSAHFSRPSDKVTHRHP